MCTANEQTREREQHDKDVPVKESRSAYISVCRYKQSETVCKYFNFRLILATL